MMSLWLVVKMTRIALPDGVGFVGGADGMDLGGKSETGKSIPFVFCFLFWRVL